MKQELKTAFWMTVVTMILFGVIYPFAVTALAQLFVPVKANGSLIRKNGTIIGSKLIGQEFSLRGYFHSRPSEAGTGYDALASGSSNLGPTNRQLIEQVQKSAQNLRHENPDTSVPVDLVTDSGSGLDPNITPAAAEFQVPRVARERGMSEAEVRSLVRKHTEGRQFGFLGEPRVNILELNLDLDAVHPLHHLDSAPAPARASLGGSNR